MMRDGKPWFDALGKPIIRAEVVNFWGVVFNPSSADRLIHTLIAAYITGAFFVMSVSAYYLLKKRHEEFARKSFSGALLFATVFSLAQLWSGDSNAKMVGHNQPAKLAAFEAHFKTGPGDLSLIGLPDESTQTTRFKIAIPGLLSYLMHGSTTAPVTGLDEVPREYWPPVVIAFIAYHAMVGIGTFFIALTLLASYFRWRRTLFEKRWMMLVFVFSVVLALAANELGWISAEVGRQPWVVVPPVERTESGDFALDSNGMLKYRIEEGLLTRNAVSEAVDGGQVLGSIFLFGVIYLLLGAVWIIVLNHKIHIGPMAYAIPDDRTSGADLAAVAGALVDHGASLSEAKNKF
jgi:cytochrome d ubiquinol oxidase subunit I